MERYGQNSVFTVSVCHRARFLYPFRPFIFMLVFLLVLAIYACAGCCTWSTHPTSLSVYERASGWWLPRVVCFGNLGEPQTSIACRQNRCGINTRQDNTVVSASGRETQEAMSYRGATLGLIAVMVFLVLFCYYGGAELWVMFAFFVIYYMISIAITRMRAELGTPVHDLHYSGPDEILTRTVSTRQLGRDNLIMFSMFWFINRAHRSHPMPHQLEGFKIMERTNMTMHRIIFALVLATVLGSLAGFWALIDRGYRLGMEVRAYWPSLSAFGIEPYRRLAGWLQAPEETLIAESGFMGIGFLLTTVLMFLSDAICMVAFSSCGICHLYELGDACYVELSFHELVNQVVDSSIWRCCAASEGSPLLFRVNLRGIHYRESLDNLRDYRWDSDLWILGVADTGFLIVVWARVYCQI